MTVEIYTGQNKMSRRWELLVSYDWEKVYREAIEMGWLDDKVQIKKFFDFDDLAYYIIEYYEEDCGCPNLVSPPRKAQNI